MSGLSRFAGKGAVFLDRDGTIIRQVELMHEIGQLRMLPGASKAIRLLNRRGIPVIVVTNQPVVARGVASEQQVRLVHEELERRLGNVGAHVDGYYFCPHHPNATLPQYREQCACRKPKPGMLFDAARQFGIDLHQSVIIGDTTQDVEMGRRVGIRTILVRTGHGGRDPWQYEVIPDWTATNLLEAVQMWLTVNLR
jgi:D-glycero-D-manno-heptose 1,7-bisphosphate phosphatase